MRTLPDLESRQFVNLHTVWLRIESKHWRVSNLWNRQYLQLQKNNVNILVQLKFCKSIFDITLYGDLPVCVAFVHARCLSWQRYHLLTWCLAPYRRYDAIGQNVNTTKTLHHSDTVVSRCEMYGSHNTSLEYGKYLKLTLQYNMHAVTATKPVISFNSFILASY